MVTTNREGIHHREISNKKQRSQGGDCPYQFFSSHSVQEEQAGPSHGLQVVAATSVDLGIVVQLSRTRLLGYTETLSKSASDTGAALHSHPVTKGGKTWKVTFQHTWMDQFPWLSYSTILEGGICKLCILFPEQPKRGGSQGAIPGVLAVYQSPHNKALGKDGILNLFAMRKAQCIAMPQTKQIYFYLVSEILTRKMMYV
ncbi:hypothetical protein EMCRGX_G011138 [Ephydatia muelleri]